MLTSEQIDINRDKFISILKDKVHEDCEPLIEYLDSTDFFFAPASTQYNCSYDGGLCEHCLNVYNILCTLSSLYKHYSEDTLAKVGLLFSLNKIDFYEKSIINKKVYSDYGSKKDNLGKFDWESEEVFKVRQDRISYGSKGFNSYMILSRYLSLNDEEITAIVNQSAGMDKFENVEDIGIILDNNNLTVLLHSAILIATYIEDKKEYNIVVDNNEETTLKEDEEKVIEL